MGGLVGQGATVAGGGSLLRQRREELLVLQGAEVIPRAIISVMSRVTCCQWVSVLLAGEGSKRGLKGGPAGDREDLVRVGTNLDKELHVFLLGG